MLHAGIANRQEFVQVLIKLCKDKTNGTVFYHCGNGDSARIVLSNGEIGWVAYHSLRGIDAIIAISKIKKGRIHFNPNLKLIIAKQDLPSTLEIIKAIKKQSHPGTGQGMTSDSTVTNLRSDKKQKSVPHSYQEEQICKVFANECFEIIAMVIQFLYADHTQSLPPRLNQRKAHQLLDAVIKNIYELEKED
jgi:hypothetical protein